MIKCLKCGNDKVTGTVQSITVGDAEIRRCTYCGTAWVCVYKIGLIHMPFLFPQLEWDRLRDHCTSVGTDPNKASVKIVGKMLKVDQPDKFYNLAGTSYPICSKVTIPLALIERIRPIEGGANVLVRNSRDYDILYDYDKLVSIIAEAL